MSSNRVILGTAQLGLNYGINNTSGKPSSEQANEILSIASKNDIRYIDTASNYGDSELIIGDFLKKNNGCFKISTKFKKSEEHLAKLIQNSLHQLFLENIEYYFYHSFEDYLNFPELKNELKNLKMKNLVNKIGVSVYQNEQIEEVSKDLDIDVIQVPFNILDNESHRGQILRQAKEKGKEIHARSSFLQGLVFMQPGELPSKLKALSPSIEIISLLSDKYNLSVLEIALRYPLSKPYIDKIVFGVETPTQLKNNINAIKGSLPQDLINEIDNINSPKELLNPTNW